MCISGILADACFTKQRAKPKDTFAGVIYSVLLVKMCWQKSKQFVWVLKMHNL